MGQVKTRLIPAIGPYNAAELHKKLVTHCLETNSTTPFCHTELWCHPETNDQFFQQCKQRFPVHLKQQHGDDLGQRMAFALSEKLLSFQNAIIIGTDCPDLTDNYLKQAINLLNTGQDAVIGPALDGGYVLLGLSKMDHSLFSNITWGSNQVFEMTTQRLQSLNWRWQTLEPLRDIDRPEDLFVLDETFKTGWHHRLTDRFNSL